MASLGAALTANLPCQDIYKLRSGLLRKPSADSALRSGNIMAYPVVDTTAIVHIIESLFGSLPVFILGSKNSPYLGGEYAIYAVEIKKACRRLCIRLPRMVNGPHTSQLLGREVNLRQSIDHANVRPFQRLITFDTSYDNALRSPYMILDWADGKPLSWTDSSPCERDCRNKVLQEVANAVLDMLSVCRTGSLSLPVSYRVITTNLA